MGATAILLVNIAPGVSTAGRNISTHKVLSGLRKNLAYHQTETFLTVTLKRALPNLRF
jgi:hypothetical protein